MKKFKLMILTSVLDRRGAERMILKLARGLNPEKYEVKVVCLREQVPFLDCFRRQGVEVIVLGMKKYFEVRPLLALYSLFKKERVDLIHTHLYRDAIYGRILARLAGVKGVISTLHNSYVWRSRTQLFLDRLTSVFADRITTVSDAVKQFAIEREHIPAEKLVTIYNGIDTARFRISPEEREVVRKELGLSPRELVVGSVGELTRQKGYRYLLAAAGEVLKTHSSVQFIIAGEGQLKDYLQARRDRLKLNSRIRFLGYREDVPRLLSAFDIFVLPSLWEGLPVALIEAMAAGKPIVATEVDGNAEVIGRGEAGLTVPPRDPGALTQAILTLLGDRALREELGRAGRRRAKTIFDGEVMIRKYEKLYDYYLNPTRS